VIVSGIAIGIIWQWMMGTSYGLIKLLSHPDQPAAGLVAGPSSHALTSLIIVDVWRNVGFSFVVFTAGLQGISIQLYEAAAVDGANEWSMFCPLPYRCSRLPPTSCW